MKLYLKFFFFVGLFFFIKISQISAGILYDVTSITKKSNDIVIEGWALVYSNSTGVNHHQVNPQFTLYVADNTNKANNLIGPINSSSAYGAFGNKDTNNVNSTFFSASNYYQAAGYKTIAGYWAEAGGGVLSFRKKLAAAIYNTQNHDNRILVNNHFEFKIPIEGAGGIKEAFAKAIFSPGSGRKELCLKLKIVQSGHNESVYGQTFTLPSFKEEITNFVATNYVISNEVKQIIGMELKTNYNKGRVTVSQGFMQRSTSQSTQACTCNLPNNSCTIDYPTNLVDGYPNWPWAKFSINELYTFYSRQAGENKFIRLSPPYKLGMYGVKVKIGSFVAGSDCRVVDGGTYQGYLPSVWVMPPAGSLMTFIQTCIPWQCLYYKDDNIQCGAPKTKTFYFPHDPNFEAPKGAEPPWCESHCKEEFDAGYVVYEDLTCKVRCNEELYFKVDKPEEVISGMGLSYPIKLKGTRICRRENLSSTLSSTCNNWFKNNLYEPNPNIEATVTLANGTETKENYVKVDNESTSNSSLSGPDNKKVETTAIDFTYNFTFKYLEPYTGLYSETSLPDYIPHGHYFYIERDQPTGNYNIKLKITDFGPLGNKFESKIADVNKRDYGKITIDCKYAVKNLHWPPTSNIPGFIVRQISLNDLFPNNRLPGDNWAKEEYQPLISEIESLNYALYNQVPLYTITLNRASILSIRGNNLERKRSFGYPYSRFELEGNDHSIFIRNTIQDLITINNR